MKCNSCNADWYYYKFNGEFCTIIQRVPIDRACAIIPIKLRKNKIAWIKREVDKMNKTQEEKDKILKELLEDEGYV